MLLRPVLGVIALGDVRLNGLDQLLYVHSHRLPYRLLPVLLIAMY
jgi:hypothetical protein